MSERSVTIYERYALAKLSEHLALFPTISGNDIIWLSKVFNITEYSDINMQYRFNIIKNIDKENLFNYLYTIYIKYSSIFPKIVEELLQKFFRKIIQRKEFQDGKFMEIVESTISRDLEILGYELEVKYHFQTLDFVEVCLMGREISDIRGAERSKLFNILEKKFKNEYEALRGAYERYLVGGADAYRQAIDSCRNAYENFFKKITETEKWKDNLDHVLKSTTLTRLVKNVYGFLSGYGTHSPKQRKKEDALLAIRLTEDIMIRVLTELKLW